MVSNIDEKLKKVSLKASKQIITRKYILNLKERVKKVIGIGIAFCGKKVELNYKEF